MGASLLPLHRDMHKYVPLTVHGATVGIVLVDGLLMDSQWITGTLDSIRSGNDT